MRRVVHIVVTNRFAGVERYVCTTANETASRGWSVTVVGGNAARMRAELDPSVTWSPGQTPTRAVRSLVAAGRMDICHVHMTYAEAVAVATRTAHRAAIVSTRHFARPRGASRAGRLVSPILGRGIERQIAISAFVAGHIEEMPDAVIPNGVKEGSQLWHSENKIVLVMQRFDPEKDTLTALEAWRLSQLGAVGWRLRLLGSGREQPVIEAWLRSHPSQKVELSPWSSAVDAEFASAGILLAPAPSEPMGLTVLEAMAAGVPVVAARSGGHLETIGLLEGAALFTPGDAESGASALRRLAEHRDTRVALSNAGRELVSANFTIGRHVDRLLEQYESVLDGRAEG